MSSMTVDAFQRMGMPACTVGEASENSQNFPQANQKNAQTVIPYCLNLNRKRHHRRQFPTEHTRHASQRAVRYRQGNNGSTKCISETGPERAQHRHSSAHIPGFEEKLTNHSLHSHETPSHFTGMRLENIQKCSRRKFPVKTF